MGIGFFQLDTEFFIPKKNKSDALAAIRSLISQYSNAGREIAFVNSDEVERAANLEEALTALRWTPEEDDDGNINKIYFSGQKSGDDCEIFESISRYIKSGSFITILEEDGEMSWIRRWLFSEGSMVEQKGTVVFE